MGKVQKKVVEEIIPDSPDRHANRIAVEWSNGGELHIHYRNLKIAILDEREQNEWIDAFREAKENLGEFFKEDI